MIDIDNILSTFVIIAQDKVGSKLSTIRGPLNSFKPAVTKPRQKGASAPSYPYIQIDLLNVSKVSGWQLQTGVDDNEFPYVDTNYKLLLQYTVYGGNAISIANELEGYFRLNSVLDFIYKETNGNLEQTFDVVPRPQKLSTGWLEVAYFNITFTITDRVIDTSDSGGVFDTIILDGVLEPTQTNLDVFVTSVK